MDVGHPMKLEYTTEPRAGAEFEFTVGADGPGRIGVLIEGKTLHESDCPDPPCHELVSIPSNAIGKTLTIVFRHRSGQVNHEDITVTGGNRTTLSHSGR